MIVVDTSVYIDALFVFDEHRYKLVKNFFRIVQNEGLKVVEPEVFKIELIGQLVRRTKKDEAFKIYNSIISRVNIVNVEKLRELAFSIASETGCRAIDGYFIATAKLTNSILITNDKIMANNAKKYGIECYYLIDEFDKAIERIKAIKA
ncbi:putative nucleic acid-binding protein [Archaeoglobus fulgidus DSM 8774]|uniref:Putative nucleic acid-binding protein n=1 Tax=Archaeoglobus fulgidus DSM 8774 TaxID=1344584 RepID=A0A075WLL5_ARCFL|nr:type II toxin-antitoxin system VapC family toxin [Archaeoglobus fulgidus]AIG98443.1 putative nucleic acid-binding protein [Archaeoglobus fulgidus DSM 8774]